MNTKKSFVILLCLVFSSCARVKISDSEFCADMGSEGGVCFKTISGEEREIPQPEWEQERFGMVCSEAATFAEWKKTILKLCNMTRRCRYSTKKKIIKFGENIEKLDVRATHEKSNITEEEIESVYFEIFESSGG